MTEPLHAPTAAPPIGCDLFCRVVDNLGDIGVCWRLARQLRAEHGWQVRLIVDDLRSFAMIAPAVQPGVAQQDVDGIVVRHWTPTLAIEPAQVVIEAFACDPPEAYIEVMAQAWTKPTWLNLEYLSTEDWAVECQWMRSPHPRLPLTKFFVFPGFDGDLGILREHDLAARRDAATGDPGWRDQRLNALGADPDADLTLFVFSYPTPALEALVTALGFARTRVQCLLAPTEANRRLVSSHVDDHSVKLVLLEPVAQTRFDEWLWLSDLNLVRGEDSFVRAQLAGVPLVWQAYPQAEEAHWTKLRSFAARYTAGEDDRGAGLWWDLQDAWNRNEASVTTWRGLVDRLQAERADLDRLARRWSARLQRRPDLASQMVEFCASRL